MANNFDGPVINQDAAYADGTAGYFGSDVATGLRLIVVQLAADPTAGAGLAAPIGSLGTFKNGANGVLYFKQTAAATGWKIVTLT